MADKLGEIVSIGIHLVALGRLAGPAMAAAVVGDASVALGCQEDHLGLPTVRGERPAVAEDDGLALPPVFIEESGAILGGEGAHDC